MGGTTSNTQGCWSSVTGVCVCVWGRAISNTRGCWSSVMEGVWVLSVIQGAVGHQLLRGWGAGAISNTRGCWSSVIEGVVVLSVIQGAVGHQLLRGWGCYQ